MNITSLIFKALLVCLLGAVYFLHPLVAYAGGIDVWRNSCQQSFSVIKLQPIKKDHISNNTNVKKVLTPSISFFKWPLYVTGMSGLVRYARDYFEGDMEKAYNSMKDSLQGSKLWSLMKYKKFYGSVDLYYSMKHEIIGKSKRQLNKIFWHQQGLILLADIAFKGYLHKAYDSAIAIVDQTEVQDKGWKKFYGHLKEYQEHALWIYFYTKKYKFIEPSAKSDIGLQRIANLLYKGDRNITYTNVRAILTEEEFKQLGWDNFTPNEDAILLQWDFLK